MTSRITGPLWKARNWAADAGKGSIHDDETASELGFRGGTVPADVHLNQFPPLLIRIFGDQWFERGNISLNFRNATIDREAVKVCAETLQQDNNQVRAWMEREDGLLVCEGTAAIGDHSKSELRTRDLRGCDPSGLRILKNLSEGQSMGVYDVFVDSAKQFDLFDTGLISDPLDSYRNRSAWGGVIACPSTVVQQLWGVPIVQLNPLLGESVGLFGAIEIAHLNGPMLLDQRYRIESEVVCVGQSPKTEYVWFDSTAYATGHKPVVTMRMMCRILKASSACYANI